MAIYTNVIVASWVVFILVWLVTALTAKRTLSGRFGGTAGIIFRIVFIAIVIAIVKLTPTQSPQLFSFNPILQYPGVGAIGALLCVIGVAFAIYARYYLGRNWGMPMSVRENPELVTTGPYTYVRHPIYRCSSFNVGNRYRHGTMVVRTIFVCSRVFCVQFIPRRFVDAKRISRCLSRV